MWVALLWWYGFSDLRLSVIVALVTVPSSAVMVALLIVICICFTFLLRFLCFGGTNLFTRHLIQLVLSIRWRIAWWWCHFAHIVEMLEHCARHFHPIAFVLNLMVVTDRVSAVFRFHLVILF